MADPALLYLGSIILLQMSAEVKLVIPDTIPGWDEFVLGCTGAVDVSKEVELAATRILTLLC